MNFTCHITYNQKAFTAMARAIRKTVRAKRSYMVRYHSWIIVGMLAVSLWLSWGTLWQMVLSCVVIALLMLVHWKEDAINGYFARRMALPRADTADIAFYPDYYLVKTPAVQFKGAYEGILAFAETRDYFLLVMGTDDALPIEKAMMESGSIAQFCCFIEEKCGHKLQNIGG